MFDSVISFLRNLLRVKLDFRFLRINRKGHSEVSLTLEAGQKDVRQ